MIRRIITTVGTSIIGKFNEDSSELSQQFKRLEKEPLSNWNSYSKKIDEYKDALLDFLKEEKSKASAEVKSLDKIIEQYPKDKDNDIEIYLLATDTILSRMAAEVIRDYYDGTYTIRFSPKKHVIKGLQVRNFDEVNENGFSNLINAVKKIRGGKSRKIQSILNITGGYKASIPILTILGQVMDIPLNYIYEDSDELIEIGQFPISINWEEAEELTPYLRVEYFKSGYFKNNATPKIIQKMSEYGLVKKQNNNYKITPWGVIFKNYVDTNLPISYSQTISHIVEYKMYEMYIKKPFNFNGIEYDNIIHSYELLREDKTLEGEIDLLMIEQSNSQNYVIVEVKSIGKIMVEKSFYGQPATKNSKEIIGVKEQFEQRQLMPIIQKKGCPPKEAHYIFFQILDGTNANDEEFIKRLKELKEVAKNISPEINFRAFLYNIGTPDNQFIYRNLLTQKTDFNKHLQEIPIP